MSKTLTIKGHTFGGEKPLVCLPIVEKTAEEIVQVAVKLAKTSATVVEWRIDFFEQHQDVKAVADVVKQLQGVLGKQLLLATFRSVREGGQEECETPQYLALCQQLCKAHVDLLDVEHTHGSEVVKVINDMAKSYGVCTVLSAHRFDMTPTLDHLEEQMSQMAALRPDIVKLAVMPTNAEDVATLLLATARFSSVPEHPLCITMSMGELGKISRVSGGIFGSVMTFAVGETASAPGQMPLTQVEELLDLF